MTPDQELRKLAEAAINCPEDREPGWYHEDTFEGVTDYNSDAPFIAAANPQTILALLDEKAADKAHIAALEAQLTEAREALTQIKDLRERKKNCYPPDWKEQIATCADCQSYKDHPIQQGICDLHRKPIYAQREHDAHETHILGYRAMEIARNALLSAPSPDCAKSIRDKALDEAAGVADEAIKIIPMQPGEHRTMTISTPISVGDQIRTLKEQAP